jgi:ankyrin repeat protein
MLYAMDPTAMQTTHAEDVDCIALYAKGFTPAHMLCVGPVTRCSMQLVRSFSVCSPLAFSSTTSTVSALHVACRYGAPTVELLQHLLQLDSSQAAVKASFVGLEFAHYPLGQLCFNMVKWADELPNAEDLVNCLLEVDLSDEVVGDALFACLDGYNSADARAEDEAAVARRNARLYEMVEVLLMANPEAAMSLNTGEANMLHHACRSSSLPSKLCIDIMKLILAIHKDAAREADAVNCLPVRIAVGCCDVEVLEFLLGVHPEGASVVTADGWNLLHLAVFKVASRGVASKVRFLCSRYPAMVMQRNYNGQLPCHMLSTSENYRATPALFEAGGIEQFKTPIAHPTDPTNILNGYLPLHCFILSHLTYHGPFPLATSETADMLRLLLRLYPEAAGVHGGCNSFKKTPYKMAVDRKLPDFFLRLLLRASPTLNPAELHRLNYEERRVAMFLAFKATSVNRQAPFLLARLRGGNEDLIRHVVSFL